MSLKPHMSWRELGDVLQSWQPAQERKAKDCAFVLACYCSTMEPTKGTASGLCEKKRCLGLRWGSAELQILQVPELKQHCGMVTKPLQGRRTYILNPTKYANILCLLKLRDTGFESNLFALSFTGSWKWGALHLRGHQAMVQL